MRNIKQIFRADDQHWVGNGFLVQPLFSHMADDRGTNPFLMLDYAAPYEFAPNETHGPRGVGQHPHKGFETVTISYHGEVAHRDSSGGGGIIYEGDVQWMTAGSGIIHEEFHSENFSKKGGLFEMVQLWVNLPAKDKNTPPRYQHLAKANIPVVEFPDEAGYLRLIAGEHDGVKGAADTFTEMNVWDIVLHADQEAELAVPDNHNLSMVVLRGVVTFNDKEQATARELVNFEQTGGKVRAKAGSEEAKILLLSGVPIDEPVVGYGPFVMNTAEEIRQAISDFKSGKFGRID
ncbi:pirin family protein [Neisseria sp. DTU_2021_1001991_1_SI_NGA_ILE_055]|uniref:pirin family protein n=1 Tax=Neisseria sp. DTU_2021_1001991_1_SI_NGA_ILE_055 TaxID=3077590 RepID=UPI0028E409D8|nr:pirin family protein [Neisseria sp. DTU_2021_1001991_1_SI_NGA_ILE_055]WNS84218.1 pirin family protein [Neisseria sp. DTU_2021_1001991_1_SI_NGA_ILE_055]